MIPKMDISGKSIQKIPLENIKKVSDLNVRHHERSTRIQELADSIEKYGLMQPIVVRETTDNKYEVIVGQRRYLAHKLLEEKDKLISATINAIVVGEGLSETDLKILSAAENMHRVELTYEDKNRVFKELFEHFGNVKEVSEKTGFSDTTVREYLKIDELASDQLKEKLDKDLISKTDAKRIIDASTGDKEKQDELTDEFVKMPKYVKQRVVEEGKNNPNLTAEEIIKKAEEPEVKPNIMLYLPPQTHRALSKAAELMEMEREDIALEALEDWLSDEGFMK